MRRRIQDEEAHTDRWLVSYADFITLLMAFFVVMYSISQVNESKYKVLSNTLTDAFHLPEARKDPIEMGEVAKSNPLNLTALQQGADVDRHGEGKGGDYEGTQPGEFADILDKLAVKFPDKIASRQIILRGNEEWLELEMKSSLLFGSGSSVMNYKAESLINEIAGILFDINNAVRVEGFTDDQPLKRGPYATNWELSTARSAAIVRQLVRSGIDPGRLAAVGYGEYQPIADNRTPEGRSLNRRVVLMISRHGSPRPQLPRLPAQIPAGSSESEPVVPAGPGALRQTPAAESASEGVTPAASTPAAAANSATPPP